MANGSKNLICLPMQDRTTFANDLSNLIVLFVHLLHRCQQLFVDKLINVTEQIACLTHLRTLFV